MSEVKQVHSKAPSPKKTAKQNGRHCFEPKPGSRFCAKCGYELHGTMKYNADASEEAADE